MTKATTKKKKKASDPKASVAELTVRCGWCGKAFVRTGRGRPRKWCKQSCRQRAFESRKFAQRLGVSDDALVVDREKYELLLDRRYELTLAVRDIRKPDAGNRTQKEQTDWLLTHVDALLAVSVEPVVPD